MSNSKPVYIHRGYRVAEGPSTLVVEHGKVFDCAARGGPALYSVTDTSVHLGETTTSAPLARVTEGSVYLEIFGDPIAQIDGCVVRAVHQGVPGRVLAVLSRPVPVAGAVAALMYRQLEDVSHKASNAPPVPDPMSLALSRIILT